MVVYRLIRATLNEAEFFSHDLSTSQVQGDKGLTPFLSGGPVDRSDLELTQCPPRPQTAVDSKYIKASLITF